MKEIKNINFTEISSIPSLIKDFLNGALPQFADLSFNLKNFQRQISEKENSFTFDQRTILTDTLIKQFSALQLSENQQENIELLKETNTFTVTTGHQLNLYTGPAFFIYKILQTIKTAEWLHHNFPDKNFVPMFWMATEDHDFDEIDHFRTEYGFYEIHGRSGGAVGRIVIEDDRFIHEFEEEFRDSVFGTELILMMKKSYVKGRTLADATRILVHELFSEYGLLILDGDEKALKSQMVSAFSQELKEQKVFNSTKNTVEFLEKNYGKVQVNPREINLFYLNQNRERIDADGENFVLAGSGRRFSREEILLELEKNPEKFSPNALMRPMYQETILPNVAYIGGNAEIMYWLELLEYFEQTGLPFPVLIPRNSMLFLKEKLLNKTDKIGLGVEDYFKDLAEIVKNQLLNNNQVLETLKKNESLIKQSFEALKSQAETTNRTFGNLVKAEETRQLRSFERMKKRLLRAEKKKQAEKVQHLESLFIEVHPGKVWQERVYNFSVFFADHGSAWIRVCYEMMDATKSNLIIMQI